MRKITHMISREKIALIFTNQMRSKMDAMAFGEKYTTSGGKGIPFHASLRLKTSRIAKIKNKDEYIGIKTKVSVEKSRIGPPFRSNEIELYFDRGMDPTGSWLKAAKAAKLVKTSGAWSTFGEDKFQGIEGFRQFLAIDEIKTSIYDQISEQLIMKYDPTKVNILNLDENILDENTPEDKDD